MKVSQSKKDDLSFSNRSFFNRKGQKAFFQRKEEKSPVPVTRGASKAVGIQKSATFKTGIAKNSINVAKNQLDGNPRYYGKLQVSLNGHFDVKSQVRINDPKFNVKENTTPKQTEIFFTAVPSNEASYVIDLPIKGDWRVRRKKEYLGEKFNIPGCKGKSGDAYFNVSGKPKNEAIIKTIKNHEEHHARILKFCFERVVGKWHQAIQKMVDNKTIFTGKDKTETFEKAQKAIGGNAKSIHKKLISELSRQQRHFHCKDTRCISQKIAAGHVPADCSSVNSNMVNVPCKDAPHINAECTQSP